MPENRPGEMARSEGAGDSQSMSRHAVVGVLGITQILAWGSSYYLPAVLAGPIAKDTGWPLAWIVGGLSLGLLVAAFVSPRVGRAIEREGGRRTLALSAIAIGAGQIGLALSSSLPAFVASWLVIGAGMGAGLYDAAFATLGRLYGNDARRAITTLTLFGGFASTVCWPLSAVLEAHIGWRGTCLAYAAIQFGFSLPAYWWLVPRSMPPIPAEPSRPAAEATASRGSVDFGALALLATTLTLAAALSATLSVHLLPILEARGASVAEAVSLGAIVGPCQVAARGIEMAIARYHHPIWTKLTSVFAVAVGITALWAEFPPVVASLVFYGAGIGLESIARGTLPLALFGPLGYATLMGRLALPSLVAQAGAPWLAAIVLGGFGPGNVLAALAVVSVANFAFTSLLVRRWAADRGAAAQARMIDQPEGAPTASSC